MSNIDRFNDLWSKRASYLTQSGVKPDDFLPLAYQDYQQVKKGNQPIDDLEAARQVINRLSGKSVSGEKKRPTGFLNTIKNIPKSAGDIFTSLLTPKFYTGLANEAVETAKFASKGGLGTVGILRAGTAKSVPELISKQTGETVDEVKERGSNPISQIAGTAGIRLLPGAYVAGNLTTSEGRKELQRNPTIAALDVLPYVGKAGRAVALASETGKALPPGLLRGQIAAGGRQARLAAPQVFPPGSQMEALAAGRPFRALSRTAVPFTKADPLKGPLSLTNRVMKPLADKINMGKIDREVAQPQQAYLREMVQKPQAEFLAKRTDELAKLGYVTDDQLEALGAKLKSGVERTPTEEAAAQLLKADEAAEVANPKSSVFADLEGETRAANPMDSTGLAVKRIMDRRKKVLAMKANSEARLAATAGRAFGLELSPSQIKRAVERGLPYWEEKVAKWTGQEQKLLDEFEKVTTSITKDSTTPVPARFVEVVNKRILARLYDATTDPVVRTDIEAGLVPLTDNVIDDAVLPGTVDKKVFNQIRKEEIANWKNLKAEGVDPVYVPGITASKAKRLNAPALVVDRNHMASIEKGRGVLSEAPLSNNVLTASVGAFTERALAEASEQYEKQVLRQSGHVVSTADALKQSREKIRAFMAANPEFKGDINLLAQQLLQKEWMAYDPTSFGLKVANKGAPEMIRADVGRALQKLAYKEPPAVLKVLSGGQRVFKTAALWSLSYPTNNIATNLALTAIDTPGALRYYPKAIKAAFDGFLKNKPSKLAPEGLPHGISNLDLEADQAHRFNAGGKVATALKKVIESKPGRAAAWTNGRWFDFSARMDDVARNAVYFEELAKNGGDVNLAVKRAGEIVNDLDDLTAVERSLVKQIIPFYSFQRHLAKYALRYPADHPIRSVILARLAEQQIEEGDLPSRFKSMFFLGEPDKTGEQWRLDTRSLNPFQDFADNFTWSGFFANATPFISGPGRAMGISAFGTPGYGRRAYDPKVGRFVTMREDSNWQTLLKEFIPQYSRLDPEFTSYTPEREGGLVKGIRKAVNLPVAGVVNTERERFLSEQGRITEGEEAVQNALRNGEYGALKRIPGIVQVKGVPMTGPEAAEFIKYLSKQIRESGYEGAVSSVLPRA